MLPFRGCNTSWNLQPKATENHPKWHPKRKCHLQATDFQGRAVCFRDSIILPRWLNNIFVNVYSFVPLVTCTYRIYNLESHLKFSFFRYCSFLHWNYNISVKKSEKVRQRGARSAGFTGGDQICLSLLQILGCFHESAGSMYRIFTYIYHSKFTKCR